MIRRRPGYTMVEVIFAMATSTVLLAGLSSAMIICSKALPASQTPLQAATQGALAVEQLADDLMVTQGFTARNSTSVEFVVDDRNKDTMPDTISYQWSGVPGDPLRRRVNGGAWSDLATGVQDFQLGYELYADTSSPGTSTESSETVLASYVSSTQLADWALTDKNWIGQYFVPTLPGNATSWKVTRVRVVARMHGGNGGITRVHLRHAGIDSKPSGAIIDEAILWENTLSDKSYIWQDLSFTNASGLTPGAGVCLILQWVKDADAADFWYQSSGASPAGSVMLTTSNAGSSWSLPAGQSLQFEVYGTYSAPSVVQPMPQTYVTAVRIRLKANSQAASVVETKVYLLNEPQI